VDTRGEGIVLGNREAIDEDAIIGFGVDTEKGITIEALGELLLLLCEGCINASRVEDGDDGGTAPIR
jgi:hypothetical protein